MNKYIVKHELIYYADTKKEALKLFNEDITEISEVIEEINNPETWEIRKE